MPALVVLDSVLPPEWFSGSHGQSRILFLPLPGTCHQGRQIPEFDSVDDYFAEEVQTVLRVLSNEQLVFLIEAHVRLTSYSRATDYEGIECVKHLRLTRDQTCAGVATAQSSLLRNAHVILHSWVPLQHLLRAKPGNLILCSRGISLISTLDAEHILKSGRISMLAQARADVEDDSFAACIRADYTPPESDHDTSNWWGVRQLVQGVSAIAGTRTDVVLPSVDAELRKLHNKKAFFLASSRDFQSEREGRGYRDELTRLRQLFQGPAADRPAIVYVDDEMDKGWGEAAYFTLTGESRPTDHNSPWFHTAMGLLAEQSNTADDWRNLALMILDRSPDLILTDLRLLGRLESSTAVKDTSGAKLVRFLREQAPAVPILLMTASNKAWTFQEAFRLGADAYWMKEGIGDHSAPSTSIRNAADLVRLIRTLLGDDYQLLRRIQVRIDEFKRDWETPSASPSALGQKWEVWWREFTWPMPLPSLPSPEPDRVTVPDRNYAFALLGNLVHMYREYLRLFTLRYGSSALTGHFYGDEPETKDQVQARTWRKEETADFWLRSLVVQIGRIIECVHCVDLIHHLVNPSLPPGRRPYQSGGTIGAHVDGDSLTGRFTRRMRRDWFGQSLYNVRNMAAHYDPQLPPLAHKHVRSLLAALFAWLSVVPDTTDCCGERWPKGQDLFKGPRRYEKLVRAYRELFGSEELQFPADSATR